MIIKIVVMMMRKLIKLLMNELYLIVILGLLLILFCSFIVSFEKFILFKVRLIGGIMIFEIRDLMIVLMVLLIIIFVVMFIKLFFRVNFLNLFSIFMI